MNLDEARSTLPLAEYVDYLQRTLLDIQAEQRGLKAQEIMVRKLAKYAQAVLAGETPSKSQSRSPSVNGPRIRAAALALAREEVRSVITARDVEAMLVAQGYNTRAGSIGTTLRYMPEFTKEGRNYRLKESIA